MWFLRLFVEPYSWLLKILECGLHLELIFTRKQGRCFSHSGLWKILVLSYKFLLFSQHINHAKEILEDHGNMTTDCEVLKLEFVTFSA